MRKTLTAISALWLAASFAWAAPAAKPFAWPNGARAAVSLAYDDALDSQLDHALPSLDKAGLKASFYLQLSSPSVQARMAEWRAAAQRGHELGNHTLFHQCSSAVSGRSWVLPHRDLARTSGLQMKEQIVLANVMLQAIDGKTERTFTAPCGDLLAAGKPFLPAVAGEFIAIKAGPAKAVPVSMWDVDPYAVPVFTPVDMSGKQMIELAKAAAARGSMLNLTFHGIGGDYLAVSKPAHDELLAYLAAHPQLYWTDTFANIMKHVKTQRAALHSRR